jgi:uncharacterized cupin superfamily protein
METSRRHPNVVNIDEVPANPIEKGTRFKASSRRLGSAAGSKALGCSHYVVPPDATAFPFHMHCVTDEAVYVLAGKGTMRIGDARIAVRAGDFIAHPAGTEAHQLVNDGDAPLEYLALSNSHAADIVLYPDSNKLAAASVKPNQPPGPPQFVVREIFRRGTPVDYYDGEDTGG